MSYRRLMTTAAVTASVITASLYHRTSSISALSEPRASAATSSSASSSNPISPLFVQPPGPTSISLDPPLLPPRSPSLQPLLVVVLTRHGARTPVNYDDGQSPAEFQALWGSCQPIDSAAKLARDAQRQTGREADDLPLDVPSPEDVAQDGQLIPCRRGQLTQLGEKQLRTIGQALRHQYVEVDGLLPPQFEPSLLSLRSTNMARTRLSLTRLVQGFTLLSVLPMSKG